MKFIPQITRREITYNNLGTSYMESGDYCSAIIILSAALNRCENATFCCDENVSVSLNNLCSTTAWDLDTWMSWITVDNNQRGNQCDDKNSRSERFKTCQTIRIPIDAYESSAAAALEVPQAIMYNLALAHQLYASQKIHKKDEGDYDDETEEFLDTAAKLYEFVVVVQLAVNAPMSGSMVFTMSTLNNLGHVHRLMGDIDRSEYYFEKLLSLIMCIVVCSSPEKPPYDLDIFFQSIMHILIPKTSATIATAA